METGASIAQLVEHPLRKRQVVCSNPTWGFLFFAFFFLRVSLVKDYEQIKLDPRVISSFLL